MWEIRSHLFRNRKNHRMALKIIHITDLHVGHPLNAGLLDQLLAGLPAATGLGADDQIILLVTGDIIDFPEPGPLAEASQALKAFQDRTGIPVVVNPGNHDMEDARIGKDFMGTPLGWAGQKKAFAEAFAWTVRPLGSPLLETVYTPMNTVAGTYYRVDRAQDRDGRVLHLVGLDSVAEDALFAGGSLGKAQLERLASDLAAISHLDAAARTVIHLHHSPVFGFPGMTLTDAPALSHAIARSGAHVDFLVFGHTHNGLAHANEHFHDTKEVLGIPAVLDGGCLNPNVGPVIRVLAKIEGRTPVRAFRVLDPWGEPRYRDLK